MLDPENVDDQCLKVTDALSSNKTIDSIYNVEPMKTACPVSEVTVIPTSVPMYLFSSGGNDDIDDQFNRPDDSSTEQTNGSSEQMMKSSGQGPTLNSLNPCSELQMPYYDSVSRESVISIQPTSNISQSVSTTTSTINVDGATTELSEEMIRSFVVGGSSLSKSSSIIHPCVETNGGESNQVPMVTAIISTSDNQDSEEDDEEEEEEEGSDVEKQVIILTEDDGELMMNGTDNLLMMNNNEDNEILVTLLGNKSDGKRSSLPHSDDLHPVRTFLSAEEILRHQPILDMNFEVVKETVDSKGKGCREVMIQTKPLRRPRNTRKRKADDEEALENYSPAFGKESGKISKPRKCPRCNLRFYNAETLHMHLNCHTVLDKEFKCYQCSFTAQHWVKMYHHLFTHGVEKPHKCPQCVFSCINKSDLTAHMFVHSKTKDWLCTKCARLFKHRRNMVAHCRVCPGVDSSGNVKKTDGAKYVCNVCSKHLSNKRNLDKHMEIHTDVKPFVCDLCGHSTRLKESLVMHKRLHTGEKPFKCDQCEYSTPDKSSLRRHKRRHTNEKPHCCPFCEYKSIQKHCLDTHIRRKHTGEQFVCGLCHYTTPDRYALNQHFKQHQPDSTTNADQSTAIVNLCQNVLTTLHAEQEASEDRDKSKMMMTETTENIVFRIERVSADTKENNQQVMVTPVQEEQDQTNKTNGRLQLLTIPDNTPVQNMDDQKILAVGSQEDLLLQQIQEPGDLVLIQENGEILIKKQDGRILIIQEEDVSNTPKT